jgi:hypothetical protein
VVDSGDLVRLDTYVAGMRMIISDRVPPPGWHRKPGAEYIERENLKALCAGASLGELEPVRTYSTGVFLVNPPARDDFLFFLPRHHEPHFLMHPSLVEKAQEELNRRMAAVEREMIYGSVRI